MIEDLRRRFTRRLVVANLIAAALILAYFDLTLTPAKGGSRVPQVLAGLAGFVILTILVLPIAVRRARRMLDPHIGWASGGVAPTAAEKADLLAVPRRVAFLAGRTWVVVAVLTAVGTAFPAPDQFVSTLIGILLAGLTATALTFLMAEDAMRPLFALALAGEIQPDATSLGIRQRLLLAWALGSGIPLLGIALTPAVPGAGSLAIPVVFLAIVGLWAGGVITRRSTRAVTRPLGEVRDGLRRVQLADLTTDVPVDDGGDIGLLQSGFNEMQAGLRERQRLHDLFGRHVGEDVARQALEHGRGLGGEQRDVSALFVDLVNSTALTDGRSPSEVVEVLNQFFAAVVESVSGEGGWVNKFEGDGALCVFGAPVAQLDHASRALRAARTLRDRLDGLGLVAGIGVSSGVAVAGNVGAEERYEYTVIGRPVHEAARVCELAKQRPCHLLAAAATVHGAAPIPDGWVSAGSVELRGFAQPTAVYEA